MNEWTDLACTHDLRSSVPPCHDIFRQFVVLFRIDTSRQTEITNFQLTVLIQEEITRFQVTMDDLTGVHEFQSTQELPDEVLDVFIREFVVAVDDLVQIRLHVIHHHVHIVQFRVPRRIDEIPKIDDVLVTEVSKHLHFPEDSFRIHDIIHPVRDFLDRDLKVFFFRFSVIEMEKEGMNARQKGGKDGTIKERNGWMGEWMNERKERNRGGKNQKGKGKGKTRKNVSGQSMETEMNG